VSVNISLLRMVFIPMNVVWLIARLYWNRD